jgi:hypothetical protein
MDPEECEINCFYLNKIRLETIASRVQQTIRIINICGRGGSKGRYSLRHSNECPDGAAPIRVCAFDDVYVIRPIAVCDTSSNVVTAFAFAW